LRCGLFLPNRADALEMRAAFAEVLFESLDRGAPERDDALFIALAANLHAPGVEAEIADGKPSDLRNAEAAGIEKLENGAVAQRGGFGLRVRGSHGSALEHFGDFGLGERFGQNFPGLGRLDVDGGVVMNAAIEKKPFIKAAETAQLARGGAGVDVVGAEVIEKCGDICLDGGEQDGVAFFKKLRKDAQIAEISLAGERAKSFFHAEIGGKIV